MNECTYKNYDELPLMLNVVQVASVLGICVASQGGASVTGRWESGKAEHRAFGAMASFAFVVRFSASGQNRSPNAACGLSPHPFSWRSNV